MSIKIQQKQQHLMHEYRENGKQKKINLRADKTKCNVW